MAEIESYSPEFVDELRRLLHDAQEQVDRVLTGWEETLELNRQLHARIAELDRAMGLVGAENSRLRQQARSWGLE